MNDKKPDTPKRHPTFNKAINREEVAVNSGRMERKGMTNIAQTQPAPTRPPKKDK